MSLFETLRDNVEFLRLVELGIHHEQQHQELLMTDLKNIWSRSPLFPSFNDLPQASNRPSAEATWKTIEEGLYEIGYSGKAFHYDNEAPRHKIYLNKFEISSRPVIVGEYLRFIEAGGYTQWRHWLHEGWDWVQQNNIHSPLYWDKIDDSWYIYTLGGFRKIDEQEVLTHISYYEADAFARWSGVRLPTEQEWEVAAHLLGNNDTQFNFMDQQNYHPSFIAAGNYAFRGQVWEWTNSSYLAYPGYQPWKGDVGEYNGKFMINQMVLRGGSCVTPQNHIRSSYRNFFHPDSQWQFSGIRLARDISE
jgi:ergothioneine biosynthesis protein EgtB